MQSTFIVCSSALLCDVTQRVMPDVAVSHGERLVFDEGLIQIDIDTEKVHFWSDFIAGCLAGR